MGGWVVKYTRNEASIMWRGLEDHVYQNPFDHIVPIMEGSTEAIHSFLEDPLFIFLERGVANWRSNYRDLIIWKDGVTERVPTVTLLDY